MKPRYAAAIAVALLALSALATAKDKRPKLASDCGVKNECAFTHFDEGCCWRCSVRVGNVSSVRDFEAYCKQHPSKNCPVPACGQASVTLDCVDGRCVRP